MGKKNQHHFQFANDKKKSKMKMLLLGIFRLLGFCIDDEVLSGITYWHSGKESNPRRDVDCYLRGSPANRVGRSFLILLDGSDIWRFVITS